MTTKTASQDAWAILSIDQEAVALAEDHGWEDAHEGFKSRVYDGAADYIREAYQRGYRRGRQHLREILEATASEAPSIAEYVRGLDLAKETDGQPEDDDEGKVAA